MLEVKKICKSYKRDVLKDVSFSVNKGEVIGIIGANGSGKSTLVSIITNNIKCDSGEVYINGENILKNHINLSNVLGYVPQQNILFNKLTVKENLEFWSKAYGVAYSSQYFNEQLLYI